MTKTYFLIPLYFLLILHAVVSVNVNAQENELTPTSTANIDQFDSVVFDLSQAVVSNVFIEFPVYFKTR